MVLTIFAGMAEFERALIRRRTQDGLVGARKRGVAFGRPPKLRRDQQEPALELIKNKKNPSALSQRPSTSIPRPSIDTSKPTSEVAVISRR